MQNTPISLLERLQRPNEHAAWERFVALYTPLLYHWARRLAVQESDAADLVQDVFAILVRQLPTFQQLPGKRFRGWLWTVLHNRWCEVRRRKQLVAAAADTAQLNGLASPDETTAVDEAEYRSHIVRQALQLMRAEFPSATWNACWEYAVVGRPAAEVAQELGITTNAVHLAKSRVLRRLREELRGLLD